MMFSVDLPQSLNWLSPWFVAILVFCTSLGGLLIVRYLIRQHLPRLASVPGLHFFHYPHEILAATRISFLIVMSALAGMFQLEMSARNERWLNYAFIVALVTQCALWANRALSVWLRRASASYREANPSGITYLLAFGLVLRIVLWSVALLFILDNLGFSITTLAASLGIGGVAVALAVQNILGDLFSSVSITLDKPFVIGDFIVIDDYLGTVEYIGLKTTRLRSLGGEQIIISNSELLKNRIRNYRLLEERRVAFEFGLSYETSADMLAQVPSIVAEAVRASAPLTRFDRAHFKALAESALQFEVVYFVLTPDYNRYMDIQQDINLRLFREFEEKGISFAHPARVLYKMQGTERTRSDLRPNGIRDE